MQIELTSRKTLERKIKEIIDFRELVFFFAWKDIRVKYKQAFLGLLWTIIQPLLLMLVFSILAKAVNLKSGTTPYSVYAFTGIIFWNIFSNGVLAAGNAVVINANIIKKIYFPKLILPISAVLVSIFDFAVSFILLFFLMIYFKIPFYYNNLFFLIPALLLIIITTVGTGVLLSAFNVKYRDFKYIIPFIIQLGFFASPVIYPCLDLNDSLFAFLYNTNPFVAILAFVRYACFNTPFNFIELLPGIIFSFLIFVIGITIFFKMEKNFADIA